MDYERHFARDPTICAGETVIKGTRVLLHTVLACLEEGASVEEIVRSFPTLTETDVRAVIAFAAASAREDLPIPATPRKRGKVLAAAGRVMETHGKTFRKLAK